MAHSLSLNPPAAPALRGTDTKAEGRRAGFAYLAIILFSIAGYATLTGLLAGGPGAALARVDSNRALFSLALAASVIGIAGWGVLGVLLYRLMGAAGRFAGILMLIFIAAGSAMHLLAFSYLLSPLGAGVDAAAFAPDLARYRRMMLLSQLFSGLWLFPFGWLIVRSRVLPRLLGLCLIVGGFGYLGVFATAFAPGLNGMIAYRIVSGALGVAAMAGEFGTCLWLLVKGARRAGVTSA